MKDKTIIDKLWGAHRVQSMSATTDLLYIDRIFLHERTGSIALRGLEQAQRKIRRPESVFVTMDHIVDTRPGRGDSTTMPGGEAFILATRESAHKAGITLFDIGDPRQGIVHVVSPEQGIALPGITLVCPDSHTGTIGGLGALAWGIGSTEAEHALATQTLIVDRPQQTRVTFSGQLHPELNAKDLILHLIGQHGAAGGIGHAIEFSGSAIRQLSIEARLTLCNMAVEFGAWTGLVAPDDTTFNYVAGRPYAPQGDQWEKAVKAWRELPTDDEAIFDRELEVDISSLGPQVTWGTSPEQVISIDDRIPLISSGTDTAAREAAQRSMVYMGVEPGQRLSGLEIDAAFIGSCTNARLSDLRQAASVLKGRKVAPNVKALCVPGSSEVKRAAEDEGLDKIFKQAGFEWRESGCSMCFFAGGESFGTGKRIISSTNRNFEGRQGPGARTHLASPTTVAASAVLGKIGHAGDL
jgi:3-isopropylmalate/(R)-2-methylmalate dehydratase large subunit